MLHKLMTNGNIRWWDRIAYGITMGMLVGATFYMGHLGARLDTIQGSVDRIELTDSRWSEDHVLLTEIAVAKAQRTVVLQAYEMRLTRLEALLLRRK